jgi:hypothetical protein
MVKDAALARVRFSPGLETNPLKQDAGRADSTGAGGVVYDLSQHFFNIIAQK